MFEILGHPSATNSRSWFVAASLRIQAKKQFLIQFWAQKIIILIEAAANSGTSTVYVIHVRFSLWKHKMEFGHK